MCGPHVTGKPSPSSSAALAHHAAPGAPTARAFSPAQVVLTRTNEGGGTLGESVAAVAAAPSLVLQGLGPRLLFGVLLTTLQFVLYGQLRGLLGVSKAALTLVGVPPI